MRNTCVLVAILAMSLPWQAASARPAEEPREIQGRALFAKGEYKAALDIYARLFAEKGDPLYLRNVGRCYQKLERPERAIDAFQEYLRRKRVKPEERAEVEGFIAEMRELEKQQAAATKAIAAPAAPAPSPAPAPVATRSVPAAPPPPMITEPTTKPDSAPGATLTRQPETEEREPETPVTHRWWFWTGLAAVIVGGVAATYVLTRPRGGAMPACPPGVECPPH
jgi:tetratricopeptide (TPR) repeat protein